MKFRSLIVLLLLSKFALPCQCPITLLSKKECSKYDIIFRGTIDSVGMCGNVPGIVVFTVKDLYAGIASEKFKLQYNCDNECFYQFRAGEEWIIYSNYRQVGVGMMEWCSRSRRFIKNEKEDYYSATSGNSYNDEVKFLQDSLGLHRLSKEQLTPDKLRNQLPTVNQQIIILICSLLCVLLFYYLFNKFFK
jgi:hypothetical protein